MKNPLVEKVLERYSTNGERQKSLRDQVEYIKTNLIKSLILLVLILLFYLVIIWFISYDSQEPLLAKAWVGLGVTCGFFCFFPICRIIRSVSYLLTIRWLEKTPVFDTGDGYGYWGIGDHFYYFQNLPIIEDVMPVVVPGYGVSGFYFCRDKFGLIIKSFSYDYEHENQGYIKENETKVCSYTRSEMLLSDGRVVKLSKAEFRRINQHEPPTHCVAVDGKYKLFYRK
ncbi:MAG: hypothetical protein WCW02_03195 [Candidatus Buchananbacteria bacterium]